MQTRWPWFCHFFVELTGRGSSLLSALPSLEKNLVADTLLSHTGTPVLPWYPHTPCRSRTDDTATSPNLSSQ